MARQKTRIEYSYTPRTNGAAEKRMDEIPDELDLARKGREAGLKNEPRTSDRELDETQRKIIDRSQAFLESCSRIGGAEIKEKAQAMAAIMPPRLQTKVEVARIRRDAHEVEDRCADGLTRANTARESGRRKLRDFEEANRLAPYSAIYRSDTTIFITLLVIMAMCEGIISAVSLMELQEGGLAGALMLSVGVSSANILMGSAAGYFGWRLAIHIKPTLRLLGYVIIAILATGAFALHLSLADLREAITQTASAQIDFLAFLKPWKYFAWTTVPPFVLFALGLALFVIAAMKGRGGSWGIASTYWGHDVVDRRFHAADGEVVAATATLKKDVQAVYDSGRNAIAERLAGHDKALVQIRAHAAEAAGIAQTMADSINDEIGRNHAWLRTYRDADRAVRNTPAPAYFDEYPAFEEWRSARLDLSEVNRLLSKAETTVTENTDKFSELSELLLQEQIALVDKIVQRAEASERQSVARLDKDSQPAPRRAPRQGGSDAGLTS